MFLERERYTKVIQLQPKERKKSEKISNLTNPPHLTPTPAFLAVYKLLSPEIRTCGLLYPSSGQATSNAFCIFVLVALPLNPTRALS